MDDSNELQFYHLNYLTLFKGKKTVLQINELTKKALLNREKSKAQYEQRLSSLVEQCSSMKGDDRQISPYLDSWDPQLIRDLKKDHGGVILALFHYGEHRHILTDLACQEIPSVAPIAGRSYWEYYKNELPEIDKVRDYLQLVEVEGENVSLELLKAIKKKGIVGIYADGNMGPDTKNHKDGTIEVQFMSKSINVKAGIARLALMFKYPVLPVFASGSVAPQKSDVEIGQPIIPRTYKNKEVGIKSIISNLYQQLEGKVTAFPEYWEYALCFHRWMNQSNYNIDEKEETPNDQVQNDFITGKTSLIINKSCSSILEQQGKACLVNTVTGIGYKPPETSPNLFTQLSTERGVSFDWVQKKHSKQHVSKILMILNNLICKNVVHAA